MVKKVTAKAKPGQFTPFFSFRRVVTGFIILLCTVVVILGLLLAALYKNMEEFSVHKIQLMMIKAVEDMGRQPQVDAQTARILLPEYRLILPPMPEGLRLEYAGDPFNVMLSDRGTVSTMAGRVHAARTMEDAFRAMPKLQACSRQIAIQFNTTQNPFEYQLVHSMPLGDGRSAYMYQSTVCPDNAPRLLEYLKQMKGY